MGTKQIFSEKLIELREKRKLSKKELAEKLGISAASVGYYESGERLPDISVACKIADFFNVTCDELLRGVQTENIAMFKEIGLEDEYIETLKAAVTERKMNRDGYEKTSIDAINALFYGITRQPDIISELAKLLTSDIDLLEMSEEESKKIEVEEINKALDGKGVFLSHSEYFDFLVQMIKNSCNDMIDIIVNHYFGTPPFPHTNMVAESIVNTVFNHTFLNNSNRLLESIKEELENAHNNPKKE